IAGSARPILDDEWLSEPVRQPLTNEPSSCVRHAAGRKADDNAHRPRGIRLGSHNAWYRWQRGNTRSEMQKSTTGKFHGTLPESFRGTAYQRLAAIASTYIPRWHLVDESRCPRSRRVLEGKRSKRQTARSKRDIFPSIAWHDPHGRVTWQSISD